MHWASFLKSGWEFAEKKAHPGEEPCTARNPKKQCRGGTWSREAREIKRLTQKVLVVDDLGQEVKEGDL